MKDFFEQIRSSLEHNLYYLALFGSLAVPDICGAMSSPNGKACSYKYKKWFDDYFPSTYKTPDGKEIFKYYDFINSEDCWYFRCSMLHQGSSQHSNGRYSRYIFVESPEIWMHCNVMNNVLNIDVTTFCNSMLEGGEKWLQKYESQEIYKINFNKFMKRHPIGLKPYITGVPVIS